MNIPAVTPEFSEIVDIDNLPEEELWRDIAANADERAALAARFGLVSLGRLEARIGIKWIEPGVVLEVSGTFSADVVQSCVVSLEPVEAAISENLALVFARDLDAAGEFVDPHEAEPLEGDTLDVGEIVAEELLLSLDPYPRRKDLDPAAMKLGPGATLSGEDDPGARPARNNPFEVLAEIKPKL